MQIFIVQKEADHSYIARATKRGPRAGLMPMELPEWRPRKPKYTKVPPTPPAGGFSIADDGSDSD